MHPLPFILGVCVFAVVTGATGVHVAADPFGIPAAEAARDDSLLADLITRAPYVPEPFAATASQDDAEDTAAEANPFGRAGFYRQHVKDRYTQSRTADIEREILDLRSAVAKKSLVGGTAQLQREIEALEALRAQLLREDDLEQKDRLNRERAQLDAMMQNFEEAKAAYAEVNAQQEALMSGSAYGNPQEIRAAIAEHETRTFEIELAFATGRARQAFVEEQIALVHARAKDAVVNDEIYRSLEEVSHVLRENLGRAHELHENGQVSQQEMNEAKLQLLEHQVRMSEREAEMTDRAGQDLMAHLVKLQFEIALELTTLQAELQFMGPRQERLLRQAGVAQRADRLERVELRGLIQKLDVLQQQIVEKELLLERLHGSEQKEQ